MAAPPSVFFPRRRGKAILPEQADHSATGSPQQLEIVAEAQQHAANARQNGVGEQGALDLFLPYKGGERKHPPFAGHHRTAFADPTF